MQRGRHVDGESLHEARSDAIRLRAIVTVAQMLARFGDSAIEPRDWVTACSYDIYDLGADEVQSALSEGMRRAAASVEASPR